MSVLRTKPLQLRLKGRFIAAVSGRVRQPEMLALLPALTLAAFWLGGEQALVITALGLPALLAFAPMARSVGRCDTGEVTTSGEAPCDILLNTLDNALRDAPRSGRSTICYALRLDDLDGVVERYGAEAAGQMLRRTSERLASTLREIDTVARLENGVFAVALAPVRRADLESGLQIATRLQAAAEAPLSVDASTAYVTFSVGMCLGARAPELTGSSLLQAALTAMEEAGRNGHGAIRSFTPDMAAKTVARHALSQEIEEALETGQIISHFQPQISTDTGRISGFEALARWQHPVAGILPPGDFLPAIHAAGLSERLSEVMLFNALTALRDWDRAGIQVPSVAVNFSVDELRNPRLADKLKWELDRFGLTPDRLTVEILETVVADVANDVIVRNVAALAAMGCGIDLDDFGTGHASITNIRRFAVSRIKIDRSFVTHVDDDQNQQKMVAAVLSMADRLGLDTLAEGVETTGEHAMLAQLGCRHVQGFGPGQPMPFAETADWMARHNARLVEPPRLPRRA